LLNRIYIAVGLFAILVLAAAFLVPRFIQWGDYRDRMEVLAASVLGTDVRIMGDIQFDLLPQPRLSMTEVEVGDIESPVATIAAIDAEFSLGEFLRDQYTLTRLVVTRPEIDLTLDEDGLLGRVSAEDGGSHPANVSLQAATIVGGVVRLEDVRAGENFVVEGIDGDLRLSAVSGPLSFQGAARYDGQRYIARLNTAAFDSEGNTRLSAFLQREGRGASVSLDGILTPGIAPRYNGAITVRMPPPPADSAEQIRGDMVFHSEMQANTDRIVLSGASLMPDENRPATRLSGAANVQLGASRSFDAVVSGGVFALPPRDPTEDASQLPYELVRLFNELPAPPVPPISGRIGLELAEMNLRAFPLRNVRMQAATDGEDWSVETFQADLPGDSRLTATGQLRTLAERPAFEGTANLSVRRLDALAQLWRRPAENNPLFNLPASASMRVNLGPQAIAFERGVVQFGEARHELSVRIGFAGEQRLDIRGRFGALGAADSVALFAALPDVFGAPGFGPSFPEGTLDIGFETLTVDGLAGEDLALDIGWSPGGVVVDSVSAADLGGVRLEGAGTLRGTLAAPVAIGSLDFGIDTAGAPALRRFYDLVGVPESFRPALGAQLPAQLALALAAPDDTGRQGVDLDGTIGAGRLDISGAIEGGMLDAANAGLSLRGFLEADDGGALLSQLGLPFDLFAEEGGVFVAANATGSAAEGLALAFNLSSNDEWIGFEGDVRAERDGLGGTGLVSFELDAPQALAGLVAGRPIPLPPMAAEAQLAFTGRDNFTVSSIAGRADTASFEGNGTVARSGGVLQVEGALALDSADIGVLAGAVLGQPGLAAGETGSDWQSLFIDLPAVPDPVRGRVAVTADELAIGPRRLTDADFTFAWDNAQLRIDDFAARLENGLVEGAASVCCAGVAADRTVVLRVGFDRAPLPLILPGADAPDGTVSGAVRLEGAGIDIAGIVGSAAGEGAFTVDGLRFARIDPQVYPAVRDLDTVFEAESEDLRAFIAIALGSGDFVAQPTTVPVTVAAGVARMDNIAMAGDGARMMGSLSLDLASLGLDGSFVMTPTNLQDPANLVTESTGRILIDVGGTLAAPTHGVDLEEMVAAIQTRASEIEIDRLEALRLIEAERQRQAAEERNRLIQQQRAQFEAEQAAREEAERQSQPPPVQPAPSAPVQPQSTPAQPAPTQSVSPTPAPQTPATSPAVNQPLDLRPQLQFDPQPNQLIILPNQRFGF
jgi:hypothetical protein